MRCTFAGTVATCLLASVALAAADFWQEKDFTAWSAQQVEKMLNDSPWARKVTIVTGRLREGGAPPDTIQSGGAGLGGGGLARNSDGGDGEFQQIRRVTVTVAWVSALPMRQALVRLQTGPGTQISPEPQQRPREDDPYYAVAVSGLPPRITARVGTTDEVRTRTQLKPNGKAPIGPADVRASRDGDQFVRVEFLFPRTDAITLDDKEVEFVTRLGDVDIKKKFRLADMVVRDRLRL
jgi:hypothetical protein